jgi:hypothetical protein
MLENPMVNHANQLRIGSCRSGFGRFLMMKIVEGEGCFMKVKDEIRLKLLVMEVFGGGLWWLWRLGMKIGGC